jgi:hypothetical protein
LTDKQIKQRLSKPKKLGRISKWAIELGEHEIEYKCRNSIKVQILADFLAKTPSEPGQAKEVPKMESLKKEDNWKLYTDRASSSDGSGGKRVHLCPELRI